VLYEASTHEIHVRTDKMFARLMIFQWLAGIAAAIWISPRTWVGTVSQVHVHVWASIFLGGAISSVPVILAWLKPGAALTRHTIAIAQTMTSALLIHLTGGRIETHFHVFGSLAFLAIYRDWRVLISATIVVAGDHLVRGLVWPQSVFGVSTTSEWRWLEHAGWVLFEDTFLFISIRQSLGDMFDVAMRRAQMENSHAEVERKVVERTAALTAAQKQLLEATRRAGMAEVATNVLHNVGNVLNSVNVAADTVAAKVRNFGVGNLTKVAALLREKRADLPNFLENDPRGRELPGYLVNLAESLATPQRSILEEMNSLKRNVEHIKEIVAMQQGNASQHRIMEPCSLSELAEDAIRINSVALARHGVQVIREYGNLPSVTTDRHQVLQILVNLLGNAKYALAETEDKRLVIQLSIGETQMATVRVIDNGIGIHPETLTQIFQHGFTTRKDGHGFGLHSGALAAQELGGSLKVHSDGLGKGATFTLELPVHGRPSTAHNNSASARSTDSTFHTSQSRS
jgi:signal transduction histidine kinase